MILEHDRDSTGLRCFPTCAVCWKESQTRIPEVPEPGAYQPLAKAIRNFHVLLDPEAPCRCHRCIAVREAQLVAKVREEIAEMRAPQPVDHCPHGNARGKFFCGNCNPRGAEGIVGFPTETEKEEPPSAEVAIDKTALGWLVHIAEVWLRDKPSSNPLHDESGRDTRRMVKEGRTCLGLYPWPDDKARWPLVDYAEDRREIAEAFKRKADGS